MVHERGEVLMSRLRFSHGVAVLVAHVIASAASATVTIDWVMVGDPGNPADTEVMNDATTGYGSVDYVYGISKYEITNAQYVPFLNAVAASDPNGLYNGGSGGIIQDGVDGSYTYSVGPTFKDRPVESASFWDAARFANWMQNGQPTGAQNNSTTEAGAYTLTAEGIAANSITRNSGATIFLTSEDEWYKAAYFNGTSFYDYPTGTDTQTVCTAPSADTGNSANCNGAVGFPTDVGAYGLSDSPYGTFDQGGNLFEWTDTIHQDSSGLYRVKRGGSWHDSIYGTPENLSASVRYGVLASFEGGFRVTMIPEPSTTLLLAFGLAGLAARRRQ
jgi:formylglycine-generating enzyme required for sulfatase activity